MKKSIVSTKNFVKKHRVAIAVVTTAAICLKLNRMALADHDEFLKEHDLYDAFYSAAEEI